MFESSSEEGTSLVVDHRLSLKGMYSMKRTEIGRSRVSSTKAGASMSFRPRMTTVLIFNDFNRLLLQGEPMASADERGSRGRRDSAADRIALMTAE